MKILFLGYRSCRLISFLRDCDMHTIVESTDKISFESVRDFDPDLIISYGYRHILKGNILQTYKDKIINLHISYLPWNRGAYPNIWSAIDDTPHGITIHLIDEGIDTGDILYQKKIDIPLSDSLRTAYEKLQSEIQDLFIKNWKEIENFKFTRIKQDHKLATLHFTKSSKILFKKLGILGNWNLTMKETKERNDLRLLEKGVS